MKNRTYEHYQQYVNDKNTSVNYIINNYLNKTQSMFTYEGLPESLPAEELEGLLQTNGSCFVTKHEGELVALLGTFTGDRDIYGREQDYLVTNPYVNINKTYNIKSEGILFKNDTLKIGLLPIIGMYAVLLTDSKISLNTMDILTRMMLIISASDDNTKESAEEFIKNIMNGQLSVIGENKFFDGIKTHSGTGSNNVQITQLIELNQYHKANLMSELGLNANFNMKRERLNESEVGLNIDGLLPFTHNMLEMRRDAIKKLNEKYDLDITVDFHSAWKLEHETADRLLNHIDTTTAEEVDAEVTNDPIDEENDPLTEEIDPINEEPEEDENQVTLNFEEDEDV